ncbi:MFS transporter [Neobacillus vireti]|uniref:MFS transporter n=1 Tax=Neobacillus vireti TaxID=220686 RepID=UPI002FFEAA12
MEKQLQKEKIWTKDFILICLANFFIFLGFQMTLPTIPLFVEDLGGNDQLIGFVVGIFTFSALLLRPYVGKALETKGRKFVYIIGLAIFVVSVGSFGFLTSIVLLFMMRVVQGGGWGFSTTASGTIASDLIPVSRRGEGMGFYGLSGNLALAFGPSLGLILTGIIPFKPFFLLCAGLGLAALILSLRITYKKVDPKPVRGKTKLDLYEKGALKPSALMFFITFTFGGIAAFLPLYTAEKHISGIQLYFLFYALALMITRTFAGQLYDRKGLRTIFIPGTLLILAAMILLAWLPNSLILYLAAILYGLGFGTVQPALQAWSIEKVSVNRRGMATATFYSFFDLGIGLGAMIFGQISHLLGYSSIYRTAAVSIAVSMLLYFYFLHRDSLRSRRMGN